MIEHQQENGSMRTPTPPPRLPAAYHAIWRALSEAGRRLGSRQALARHLHVSTHTLQRLLTRGDVPSFPETKNPRVVRAWVRTITRLARGLGHEPRDWVESVGIPWDETAARVSEAASRDRVPLPGRTGSPRAMPTWSHGPVRLAKAEIWPSTIAAAVVDCPPFSTVLPRPSESFLLAFARRLIGAIQPATRIDTRLAPEEQVVSGFEVRPDATDLGLGVVDTVDRRRRGPSTLVIPGVQTRLTALTIHQAERHGAAPTWSELVSSAGRGQKYVLVFRGGIAMHYLLGQCGTLPDTLLVRSPAPPDRAAEVFLAEARRRPTEPVILVCREEIARLITNALQRSEHFSNELLVSELEDAPEQCPVYPLAVAVGPSMAPWLDLLQAGRDEALLGSDWRRTARLYAELAAVDVCGRARIDSDDLNGPCRFRVLADFEQATDEFQNELCHHLLATLAVEVRQRLEARGEIKDQQTRRARADGLAALYARRAIPDRWQPVLDTILGQLPTPPESRATIASVRRRRPTPVLRCRSCSVSLLDEDHRGVSDRYCRFCADEHGHLRPKHEVQALIARWFRYWQVDLPEDEAMRRADLYMRALPAWNDN